MRRLSVHALLAGLLMFAFLWCADLSRGQFKAPKITPPKVSLPKSNNTSGNNNTTNKGPKVIFDTATTKKQSNSSNNNNNNKGPKLIFDTATTTKKSSNSNNSGNLGNSSQGIVVGPNPAKKGPRTTPNQNSGTVTVYGFNNFFRNGGGSVTTNNYRGSPFQGNAQGAFLTTPGNFGNVQAGGNQNNQNNQGAFQGGTQADAPIQVDEHETAVVWINSVDRANNTGTASRHTIAYPVSAQERQEVLQQLHDSLPANSLTARALDDAINNRPLTQDQLSRLHQFIRMNNNLTPLQRGAIYSAMINQQFAPLNNATQNVLGQQVPGIPTGGKNSNAGSIAQAIVTTFGGLLANLANLTPSANGGAGGGAGGGGLTVVDPSLGLYPPGTQEEPPQNVEVSTDNLPNDIQKFDHAFLRVRNNTKDRLAVYVQYYTYSSKDQAWKWFPKDPSKEEAVAFAIAPGDEIDLFDGDWKINAAKVRIWAQAPSGRVFSEFLQRDLWLVPLTNGERCYYSDAGETFVFSFNPLRTNLDAALNNQGGNNNQAGGNEGQADPRRGDNQPNPGTLDRPRER